MIEYSNELGNLEREIAAELRNNPPQSDRQWVPPDASIGVAPHVVPGHPLLPSDIGKPSDHEYELVAREIECTGIELMERAKQCEAMINDALGLHEELKLGAERLRREAALISRQMQNCTQMTSDVRKVWGELKDRIDSLSRTDRLASPSFND